MVALLRRRVDLGIRVGQQAGDDHGVWRATTLGLDGELRTFLQDARHAAGLDVVQERRVRLVIWRGLPAHGELRAFLDDLGHIPGLNVAEELRVRRVSWRGRLGDEGVDDGERDDHQGQHHDAVSEKLGVQRCLRIRVTAARRPPRRV